MSASIGTHGDAPRSRALGLLVAWGLIDATLGLYLTQNGTSILTTILLASGIAVFFVAAIGPGTTVRGSAIEGSLIVLLAGHVVLRLVAPYRPESPAPTIGIEALAAIALAAVILMAWGRHDARVAAGAVGVVIGCALAARAAIVIADIPPVFDVWAIQEAAAEALLRGRNPYETQVWPHGYPYWPGSAIMAALGHMAGDVRWSSVIADGLIATGMIALAVIVGRSRQFGAILAALYLWSSSGLYMTWQAFPEPGVIAFAVAATIALAATPSRPSLAGSLTAVAAVVKQFGIGFLVWLPSAGRPRAAIAGAITLAALVGPFLLADPARFLEGTFLALLREPPRAYAINLLEPLPGVLPRLSPPFPLVAMVAIAASVAVHARWPRSTARWLMTSATLLLVVYALSGISFVNYFQIVLASILLVVLLVVHPAPNAARAP